MRRAVTAAAALVFAASPAQAEISGLWRIKIVDGPSRGDHGVIDLTPAGPADASPRLYNGVMRFTDVRYDVTALERCRVEEAGQAVTVRCETDQPNWLPDDFDLAKTGPNEMRGPHLSAVSGEALFYRAAEDLPLS